MFSQSSVFALINIDGNVEVRLVEMESETQNNICLALSDTVKVMEEKQPVEFDGKYKPNGDELLMIKEFVISDEIADAIRNPLSVATLSYSKTDEPDIRAIFVGNRQELNGESSLFKYLQIFVISNGTDTRYFANTTKRDKNSFDFTMNWARRDNEPIRDLKDFTATFLSKRTLLNVLINYSVFDSSNTLLIMRPYQIAATERILWKIKSAHDSKLKAGIETGGYIWHTTGSGKTLTSFKAARLATELEFIDKVFFVVDRKDLDYQTMKEYQRFSPDSVNGSDSTAGLKRNIEKEDNKIIVTTIQKLNNLMKTTEAHEIYDKQVVFIFDECHRSQFGETQKNLKKKFKHYYQFGFTGTPIFPENALGSETTASVFGRELHSYVITDAIRDQKVLKFMVDYNDVRPQFASLEAETDEQKLSAAENRQALLHPTRIHEISDYILNHFAQKTHRTAGKGFNAMFAVSSVEAAKLYYEELQKLQEKSEKKLTIATIFLLQQMKAKMRLVILKMKLLNPQP